MLHPFVRPLTVKARAVGGDTRASLAKTLVGPGVGVTLVLRNRKARLP